MTAEQLGADGETRIHRKGAGRRLNGWKEIGAYFQKNERTVKRWEQRGLPIHRLPGGANTAVFAFADELEVWLKTSRGAVPTNGAQSTETETPQSHSASPLLLQKMPTAWYRWRAVAVAAGIAVIAVALGAGASHFIRQDSIGDPAPAQMAAAQMSARHEPPAAAHQLYLNGLYHWNTRSRDGLEQARREFAQAIALDPQYAAAQAGLANAYNLLAQYDVMKAAEAYPLAKAAAEQAIALDSGLADGYSALGFAMFYGYKDLRRSEALFQQALARDPASSRTFHWYALIMMHTGQFEEPLRAITRAQELDPDSHAVRANRGLILFYAGQVEAAIDVLTDLTRSAPDFLSPHYYLATIYLDQQRYDDYLRESLNAAKIEGNLALKAAIEAGAEGYRNGGAKGLFAAMLAVQKSELASGQETAFNVARTAALLGDNDTAFASLRQSLAAGEPDLLGVRIDRSFKTLRGDARFQTLATNVLDLP
jgi:tetratricopeptide (TPR) repeat protein